MSKNKIKNKKGKLNNVFKEKLKMAKKNKRIDEIYDNHMQILMLLYNNKMSDNLPFISSEKMKKDPKGVFTMLFRYYSSNFWGHNPTFMTKKDLLIYKM